MLKELSLVPPSAREKVLSFFHKTKEFFYYSSVAHTASPGCFAFLYNKFHAVSASGRGVSPHPEKNAEQLAGYGLVGLPAGLIYLIQ